MGWYQGYYPIGVVMRSAHNVPWNATSREHCDHSGDATGRGHWDSYKGTKGRLNCWTSSDLRVDAGELVKLVVSVVTQILGSSP